MLDIDIPLPICMAICTKFETLSMKEIDKQMYKDI